MRSSYKTRLRAKRTRQKIKKMKILKKKLRLPNTNKAKRTYEGNSHPIGSNKSSSKSSKSSLCYMCDKVAETVEHAPPKCLFPKNKDVSDNINYREQLITVPSCKEHNIDKSQDDEYILYTLVMNIPTNQVGRKQLSTTVKRAIERRPQLINLFLENQKQVYLKAKDNGLETKSIALKVDIQRFNSAIEMMVRALYFSHYKEKCCGEINIFPSFLFALGTKNSKEINQDTNALFSSLETYFKSNQKLGENPEVFYYQVTKPTNEFNTVFKLVFYGGCSIAVFIK
jgi:hypothetical protein